MGMTVAQRMAKAILNGFDSFFGDFKNVTLLAQGRFERAEWAEVHTQMSYRLTMYKRKLVDVVDLIAEIVGDRLADRDLWQEAKEVYAWEVRYHNNFEVAQTFFNSCYCRVFKHERVRDLHAFVMSPPAQPVELHDTIHREYILGGDMAGVVSRILRECHFELPFEDFARDVERICGVIRRNLHIDASDGTPIRVQVLDSLLYRNKAAYLVGRFMVDGQWRPFVLPFLNNESGGVFVDTVLYDRNDLSILFSFTRAYFMVDAAVPSQYVAFLKDLMPNKEIFELYSALGFVKHGKTEFYRYAVQHTLSSDDQYVIAPGIKGMVMLVFTRPSFDYVYKVIKERFTPPKDMTREEVEGKYRLVKSWDRAGRMADTQEFSNLAFDRRRFSDELMAELQREVPSLLEESGNALVIRHVYVERKMIPLNLYLRDASDEQLYNVMDEYGNAIKQLAAANIFPGDMLLKNFGVTRHGRVVFYDYDEICPLTDCNFRKIPPPQTEEQAMSSHPWYDVARNDVFPEEFRLFFSGNRRAKEVFDQLHPELYDADFWQGLQDRIRHGEVADVFPYRRKIRFERPA